MRIKLTIIRAKIDCAGLTAPKQLRSNPEYNVGDSLSIISDSKNMQWNSDMIGCPNTANIKKTSITMYGSGWMKLKLTTDNFRSQDTLGNDALKQRYDGSFVASVKLVPKYSDCIPGITRKHFKHLNERIFMKSPGYPRYYAPDSQCRVHFTVAPGLKLVYKLLKLDLKTRSDTCSAELNDAILWLANDEGCANRNIFEGPGQFKPDQLVDQNCGKARKQKTYTNLGGIAKGCFIFAANGARLEENSNGRTGRFMVEVRAVDESYQPKSKKKRKRRSLNGGIPVAPIGLID